ncbi:MAG: GNAT family N-acetyltransferase [Planctomycetaceae bacterium]|nr:MAG: GNAT family N-acetyltransferase [Planctomycetaceae bacterium]
MPVIYRHATPEDIDAIVRLHTVAFPGFFLTSLGGSFLRLLYRAFVDIDGGICIVAQDGDCMQGVVVGAADPASFFTALRRRRGVLFALAATPGLLRNPLLVVRKCAWALFYRGEQPAALSGAGLLSSVAVSPEMSSKGIGQKLVDTFCEELRRHNAEYVYLITDETDNERVNRFYRKCGFHLVDTFERFEKRRMNRWAKSI